MSGFGANGDVGGDGNHPPGTGSNNAWSGYPMHNTAAHNAGDNGHLHNAASNYHNFTPRPMTYGPYYFPAPDYPPNTPFFYWAGAAQWPADQYTPQTPYCHVGSGWFRPNPTFDPVAAGFVPPPLPMVYILATLADANKVPGTNLIMHEDPPVRSDGEMQAKVDASMKNPEVARVALEAPSKKVECRVKKAKSVRRSDGRINLSIAQASEEMQTALRNSAHSPLLSLPGEIRMRIWRFVLGGHTVEVSTSGLYPHPRGIVHADRTLAYGWVTPSFSLPRVSRQLYLEASALIYTSNTFAFETASAFDGWSMRRVPGQRRMVVSVAVPDTEMRQYVAERRRLYTRTFPMLQRIVVREPEWWQKGGRVRRIAVGEWEGIEQLVEAKEGRRLEIEW